MTKQEFADLFLNKNVRIRGLHPGKNSPGYSHIGKVEQVWCTPDGCVAFSACHYTWPGIDYWREMDGQLIGFYTAAVHPESEPGIIRITEVVGG